MIFVGAFWEATWVQDHVRYGRCESFGLHDRRNTPRTLLVRVGTALNLRLPNVPRNRGYPYFRHDSALHMHENCKSRSV